MEWIVPPGAAVAEGEDVAVIETDKSTMELAAPSAGQLGRHRYNAGAHVPVGKVIAYVLHDGEREPDESADGDSAAAGGDGDVPDRPATEPHEIPDAAGPGAAGGQEVLAARPPSPADRRRAASPRARRLAQEAAAAGSVAEGAGPARGPAPGRHRTAIADAVARSWATIPHFTVSRDIPADELVRLLAAERAAGIPLTFTDLLLKVFAEALAETLGQPIPALGLAVATDGGAVIRVVPEPGSCALPDLASARAAAVERARAGRAAAPDALLPIATLSNLGPSGVRAFTGIIPFGQQILLTTGAIEDRAVFAEHGIIRRRVFDATLNLDHRYYDGAHGAAMLARMAELAAAPVPRIAPARPLTPPAGE